VKPYVLSDVAPLGAGILQSVQQAIATADHVLVVLAGEAASLNSVFEAGMAVGLGKSVVIMVDPEVAVPADLAGFLTVRARPDDLDAINFALDRAEGRITTSTRLVPAMGYALGPRADQMLNRAAGILALTEPAAIEQAAMDLLVLALEDSGAVAVQSAGRDRFDLGVWFDDLDAIAANPLLIELKRSFRVGASAAGTGGAARRPHRPCRIDRLPRPDQRHSRGATDSALPGTRDLSPGPARAHANGEFR